MARKASASVSAFFLRGRERGLILAALAACVVLAWAYLFAETQRMAAMSEATAGVDMASMAMPRIAPWSLGDWLMMLVMWAIMMVGMMLPSATPAILLYAKVAARQRAKVRAGAAAVEPIAPTTLFVAGYLMAWTGFSIAATALQHALERVALLTPEMAVSGEAAGGLILVWAGAYQFTALKNRCLEHCRSPVEFLSRHWRRGALGAAGMGIRHGAYCVGCCWALMALLFVGGVMNLLWVTAIAVFVLAEKCLPGGIAIRRVGGSALIVWGLWTLAHAAAAA
ncbi:MAG: DUF2182 domain-containing protein [Rhodospirillales bacterium]|nr:DUF2182 domain-containing protein [Rhodospirillales bacterium]